MTEPPSAPVPDFIEDPFLAEAVREAEDFVGSAGWNQPPQMFALVVTTALLDAEPGVAAQLDQTSYYTPIAQEPLQDGDLADALSQLAWPAAVAGCILIQEIVVLPPDARAQLPEDPVKAAEVAAGHPDRTEARLAVGVLRDGSAACLMRLQGEHIDTPLRGADLAPNLVTALKMTLQ